MSKTQIDSAIVENCELWSNDLSTLQVNDTVAEYLERTYPGQDFFAIKFSKIYRKYCFRRKIANVPTVYEL